MCFGIRCTSPPLFGVRWLGLMLDGSPGEAGRGGSGEAVV